MNIAGQGIWH